MADKKLDENVTQLLLKMYQEGKIENMNKNMPLGLFPSNLNMEMNPNIMFYPPPFPFFNQDNINFQNQYKDQLQDKDEIWTLIFERKYDNNKVSIKTNPNDTVNTAISKYRIKSLESGFNLKFSFLGKPLDTSLTLRASGLSDNSTITVEKINKSEITVENYIILFIEMGGTDKVISIETTTKELLQKVFERFSNKIGINTGMIFTYNSKTLNPNLTVAESKLRNGEKIIANITFDIIGAGPERWKYKEINIKFIKISENSTDKKFNSELTGLLNLCLLKEIASKLDFQHFLELPKLISYILQTLKNGQVMDISINETIKAVLQKMGGSNIINFSNFVNESINEEQLNKIMESLNSNDLKIMNDIKFRLSKYNDLIKLFNKEFEKAKRESIFEFSVISLVIIEREDYEKFVQEREKCENRVDKILYHGTSIEPISCILTGLFKKSVDRCYQHGKGVYLVLWRKCK